MTSCLAMPGNLTAFNLNGIPFVSGDGAGNTHLTVSARGGGRQEISRVGTHKEGINYFCWVWFSWHAFYRSQPTKVVSAEYEENAVIFSFIFFDLDLVFGQWAF